MEYEVHCTIKSDDIERFKDVCSKINVKPIYIDVTKSKQMITSSKHKNDNYKSTLYNIQQKLKMYGYDIIRSKIEKRPHIFKDENFIYYETHLRLTLPKKYDRTIIEKICSDFNFHISRNILKSSEDYDYQMIIYRNSNCTFEYFINIIDKIKNRLTE